MVSRVTIGEAIETYNEYRGSMATAELLEHAGDRFTVEFEGPFCRMCCDYDYFEDLSYELQAIDEDIASITITAISYEGGETFRVEYSTEAQYSDRDTEGGP